MPRDALRPLLVSLCLWGSAAQSQAQAQAQGQAQAQAQEPSPGRPLVIPQEVGARQGRVVGRAVACGLPAERVEALLRTLRERMQGLVGRALTDERYVLALNEAVEEEAGLPRPAEAACARAAEAFARLETGG